MIDSRAASTRESTREYGVVAALAAIALGLQFLVVPIDADVSWLITVSERVLAGQRLYVDVFEVNPPASVWLYLPQVALAHAIGLRPETVVVLLTTAIAAAATLVTASLSASLKPARSIVFVAAIGAILLVMPGGLFAQREHVALALSLPIAAIMARLSMGHAIAPRTLFYAGVAAGAVIVIKPHFAFAILVPALWAGWKSDAWRPIFLPALASAAVVALYGAAIALFTPAYFDALPMLAEVYGPMRAPLGQLLIGASVATPIVLGALAIFLRPPDGVPRLAQAFLWMAGGFTIAVLLQGKGYWNHALPGLGLALAAIATSALSPDHPVSSWRIGAAIFAFLTLGLTGVMVSIQPPPGLVTALRRIGPPNPTMISLGTELSDGHPAVRLVDGHWVGTRAALYTAAGVRYRTRNWTAPASRELRHWYDEDIDLFARDVAAHHPDVVLTELESMDWLAREPAVRSTMADYQPVERVGKIGIWRRRDAALPSRSRAH